jgi:hypothetical protein
MLVCFAATAAVGLHERAAALLLDLVKEEATPVPLPTSLLYHGHDVAPAAAAVYWAMAEQRDAMGDVNACAAAAAAAAQSTLSTTSAANEGDKKKKKPKFFKDMSRRLLKSPESCTSRAAILSSHFAQAAAVAAVNAAAAVLLSSSSSAAARAQAVEHVHGALSASPASAGAAQQHCIIDLTSLFHPSFIQSFLRSLIIHRSSLPLSFQVLSLSLVRIIATPPPTSTPCSMGHRLEFADVPQSLLEVFMDQNEHFTVRLEAALGLKVCLDSCGKFFPWMELLGSCVAYVIEATALRSQSPAESSSPPSLPSHALDSLAAAAAELIRHFVDTPVANKNDAHVKVIVTKRRCCEEWRATALATMIAIIWICLHLLVYPAVL